MRVLAAMSGGVDSSVAAALMVQEGHEVTGVTLRLWSGAAVETGCCSEAEIDDARRVANHLSVDHLVWTFTEEFDALVVEPYVAAHATGRTPNPCIECNRHLKFGRLLRRAEALGFDAVATGHHARVVEGPDGARALMRGMDVAKDQSYVLYVLGQPELAKCLFPVGWLTKAEVRAYASSLGLPTAEKPDSQDACFVTTAGSREAFLADRIPLHAGRVVGTDGVQVGTVAAVEMVTIGQRRGLGGGGGTERRYALAVDPASATVIAGTASELDANRLGLREVTWVGAEPHGSVEAQCGAHARAVEATWDGSDVAFTQPHKRVAPGQSVVLYHGDRVLGGGMAI